MQIGILILSAGYSSRMGGNKALLKFNKDYTFLDQLISQYHMAKVNHIKIISQKDSLPLHENIIAKKELNIYFLKNKKPQLGRSYSISLGLKEFKSFDFVFIQNIDNPFTDSELIKMMISKTHKDSAIIPKVGKKNAHPILIPKKLIDQILLEDANSFDFRSSFSSFPKLFISWMNKDITSNINTQKDYQQWIGQE